MSKALMDMIATAIDAFKDGALTADEAKELLAKLATLLKVVGNGLPDPRMAALLTGVADLLAGIGEIIADPTHGIDELLDGLGDAIKGVSAYIRS